MKISPMAAPSNSVSPSDVQSPRPDIRSLKMATNATPEYARPPQELLISDDNTEENKADPIVEATQPISAQSAALARERRAFQQQRRAFEDQKKEFEAAKAQGSDSIPLTQLKSDPLSVLQKAGVSYQELADAILNNQGSSEVNALKAEINALKEGVDKKFVDRETQEKQRALASMQVNASKLIAEGDTYELVRETRSLPDVMRLIEKTYDMTGEVIEVPEALQLIEDELFKRNQKLAGLKKLQGLFKQPEPVVQQQRPQGMRTLTNKDTASPVMTAKQRAMAAFYGNLKK